MKTKFLTILAAALTVFAACDTVQDPQETTPAPEITSISPAAGAVGTTVVITGKNFSVEQTKVFFAAAEASVSAATETSLTVTAPENELGAVKVKVVVGEKTAEGQFTYVEPGVPVATITDQSAIEGKPGSTLIFTGVNLGASADAYVVKFNDVVAEISSVTAEAIMVTVPASDGT